jgi:hypothetical protein
MPRGQTKVEDTELLRAALEGLEAQKRRIDDQIKQVQAMLGRRKRPAVAVAEEPAEPAKPRRKRQLSAAARQRIAAAQKRRWAEYRKGQPKE